MKRSRPWATRVIVSVNLLVLLWELRLLDEGALGLAFMEYGLLPARLWRDVPGQWPTLVTHAFLHGSIFHFGVNMYSLWAFGPAVEERTGSLEFLSLYLLWGIAAALAHALWTTASGGPCVGASGAIAGALGAAFVLSPTASLELPVLPGSARSRLTLAVPRFVFLGPWFAAQMGHGIGSLSQPGWETAPVAYWAHAGGFAAGAFSMAPWLNKRAESSKLKVPG